MRLIHLSPGPRRFGCSQPDYWVSPSFAAAAPLLEALSAGAIETGLVGDAPFTFAAAAKVPVKAIAAIRQTQEGLAVLVPETSAVNNFDDLRGKKIATGRGSIGHQLVLAALESRRQD